MHTCAICNREFKSAAGLVSHVVWRHSETAQLERAGEPPPEEPDERTLEMIGELLERLDALEALEEERQPESPEAAIARLRPALNEWLRAHGAHPGLCTDASCSPCRSARAEVAQHSVAEGREQFAGELEAAARWGERVQLAEDLAQCHSNWVAAGRPAADERRTSDRNGKSPGRRFIRVTRS